MKIIIDTDPGLDDAVALCLVLKRNDVEIVGITTVRGNVEVAQSTKNILKILEVFDRKDIPVFQGAQSPILGKFLLIGMLLETNYFWGKYFVAKNFEPPLKIIFIC